MDTDTTRLEVLRLFADRNGFLPTTDKDWRQVQEMFAFIHNGTLPSGGKAKS